MSLDILSKMKRKRGEEKDKHDIQLIQNHSNFNFRYEILLSLSSLKFNTSQFLNKMKHVIKKNLLKIKTATTNLIESLAPEEQHLNFMKILFF